MAAMPVGATRSAPGDMGLGLEEVPMAHAHQHARPAEHKAELKEIAKEIGVLEYQEDEYDIPTFLRKSVD